MFCNEIILILTASDERGEKLMTENVVVKIKDALEDLLGDKKAVVRILSVVLILLVALVMRIHDQNKSDITIETEANAEETEYTEESNVRTQVLFVDIGGAVNSPGVYQVPENTRLFEVIDMAGGLTEDADADHVNRASFVEDGQKIIIPVKGDENTYDSVSDAVVSAYPDSGLVNINTAPAEELQTLSGIGKVMAERIIEYRSSNSFKSKEDIMSVEGIGNKTYEKIKDSITV